MNLDRDIWAAAAALLSDDEEARAALVVLVEAIGSGPNGPGAKMLVARDGSSVGTVGGGDVEHVVRREALALLAGPEGASALRHYEHRAGAPGSATDMICAGEQRFAILVLGPSHQAILTTIAAHEREARPARLALSAAGLEVFPAGRESGRSWQGGAASWRFEEDLGRRDVLTLVGGGHVALALSRVAATLGFHVVVLDDRPDLPTMAANVFADEKRVVDYEAVAAEIPTGPHSYVAVMTAGHRSDKEVVAQLAGRDLAYLAMLGSAAKVKSTFARLREEDGVTDAQLARLHAPAGLPIRSKTPAEIAISIAAQLVQVRAEKRS